MFLMVLKSSGLIVHLYLVVNISLKGFTTPSVRRRMGLRPPHCISCLIGFSKKKPCPIFFLHPTPLPPPCGRLMLTSGVASPVASSHRLAPVTPPSTPVSAPSHYHPPPPRR